MDEGLTAVHLVIGSAENDFEVIKQCLVKLIESGFGIDEKSGATDDESGYTPLYSAIEKNNQKLVDFHSDFQGRRQCHVRRISIAASRHR